MRNQLSYFTKTSLLILQRPVFLFYKDQSEKAGKELERKYRGQGNKIKVLEVVEMN